jgi:tRNA A-37 threonylcarbamoyl transferase component Bud32
LQASIPTEVVAAAAPRPTPPTREELADAFPQLEILELIGQGGMGFVFKARQPKLDRLVALKILPQSLAADPAFAERFTREGRMLARLNHPNIVIIHDFGQAGGFFYLLMEYVDGVNLRQAMRVGRFTPMQALAIVPKICEALQFAHNEGILHRDIKPENILLDSKGRVKIADFGIAKLLVEGQTPATLTGSGATLGTPHYMAPEQIERPGDVDHRADIYSLGVVFYEMLTGELPIGRFAPPSEKSTVDPRMDEVVLRALEKERERRPQSAGEVKTQVETIAGTGEAPPKTPSSESAPSGNGRASRRALVAAVLACASLVLFALGFLAVRSPESICLLLAVLGIPALGGTVMGIVTLANFRHSASRPAGLKSAMLAALAWPLVMVDTVFVAGFLGFFLSLFHHFRGGLLDPVLVLFCIIAVLALDFAIVWSVLRWVKRLPLRLPSRRATQWLVGGAMLWTFLFMVALLGVASRSDHFATPETVASGPGDTPDNSSSADFLGLDSAASEGKFVIEAAQFEIAHHEPGQLDWGFKCFVPPDHLASILFVRWTNGVPNIDEGFSAYFKVGKAGGVDIPFCSLSCYGIPESQIATMTNAENRRLLTQWLDARSTSVTNVVQWNVNLGLGFTSSRWLAMPPYHRVETALPLSLRSHHQRVIRLVDFTAPEEDASHIQSGVELRILLEPLKSPPIRMVPNEMDRTNYVAGTGLAGTMEDTLRAIEQWPTDP